jgi:signal transduction histidine kinase
VGLVCSADVPERAGASQLRRLLDAVVTVGSDLSLPKVLERIVETAVTLVDARYGALGVLDPSRTYLSEFITVGLTDEQRARIGELPKGQGILGLIIIEPRPLRLTDIREHPDAYGFVANHPTMTSFLGVPIFVHGEVFGNLYLTDKRGGEGFTDIDEELTMALASAAAVAIDNARLHERSQELRMVEDRERIARDLHDTVIQRLFATGLALQGVVRRCEPELAQRLQQAVDDIDDTVRQVRTTIFELDTRRTPGRSLRREVLDLCAEATRTLGFDPQVSFDGPIDAGVPDAVAEHLLATIREALTNVAKHAGARRAEVRIDVDTDEVRLVVRDDGRGGVAGPTATGHGVRNMAERANRLGGSLLIEDAQGGGTAVRWTVPLPR